MSGLSDVECEEMGPWGTDAKRRGGVGHARVGAELGHPGCTGVRNPDRPCTRGTIAVCQVLCKALVLGEVHIKRSGWGLSFGWGDPQGAGDQEQKEGGRIDLASVLGRAVPANTQQTPALSPMLTRFSLHTLGSSDASLTCTPPPVPTNRQPTALGPRRLSECPQPSPLAWVLPGVPVSSQGSGCPVLPVGDFLFLPKEPMPLYTCPAETSWVLTHSWRPRPVCQPWPPPVCAWACLCLFGFLVLPSPHTQTPEVAARPAPGPASALLSPPARTCRLARPRCLLLHGPHYGLSTVPKSWAVLPGLALLVSSLLSLS